MSRSIVLSNGELCVTLDSSGSVRDVYYPHIGSENHVRGHYIHRVGIWADGRVSWLSDGSWHIEVGCETDSLTSVITARNDSLGVELRFADTVAHDQPVFFRKVIVHNLWENERELKLYFGQEFEIHKMHGSDTAFFDPNGHSIIHYKGQRAFLVAAYLEKESFQDFVTGRAHFNGQQGSYRDADDGSLTKNAVEHGPADSVIGLYATYAPQEEKTCEYWLVAGTSVQAVQTTHSLVKKKTPAQMAKATLSFWRTWVNSHNVRFPGLSTEHVALFKRSLMYMRAHVDHGGGIVASVDSDMFQYGIDTYSYVWHRDASYVAMALDAAGDTTISRKFFDFSRETITKDGYFMHKYSPDKSLGSSWHPWYAHGKAQLPIQEDETAIVMYALNEHIRRSRDFDLLEEMYEPLVERPAKFLLAYRDKTTGLPLPSYDLWERKRGSSTYTSSSVVGGLRAAAELSRIIGKDAAATKYTKAADSIATAIMEHLWRQDAGLFHNHIDTDGSSPADATVDISSVYGVFLFGVLPIDDPRLESAFEKSVRILSEGIPVGGIARFEHDDYYHAGGSAIGNPWIMTTLWYAQYLIARAQTESDLTRAIEIFNWVSSHALPSGVLSEQLDPVTGAQVCAGPLTWSHSTYVHTILKYLARREELRI